MEDFSILSDDFVRSAKEAGLRAREQALAEGHSVVYVDSEGRYVEERPDGRKFEIRLDSTRPRRSRRVVIRELASTAA